MHDALHLLIWCTVVDVAILIVWFLAFTFAHDIIYRMHNRWFKISVETFDTIHYGGMAVFKILLIVFNLVPLIALHFV